MFLLYVDASGAPELNGDRPVYASIGVCVHEGTWFALGRRVRNLKRRYAVSGEDFELHAKDFCCSIREQDEIKDFESMDRPSRKAAVESLREHKLAGMNGRDRMARKKKYAQTRQFTHLTRSERSQLLKDCLDLVGTHDGIRLFGEVVDKQVLFARTGEQDATQHNFTQLVTRFDAYLQRFQDDYEPETPQKGMLVMDREPTQEARVRSLMDRFRGVGHPWGKVKHVIETPFFIDSRDSAALQVADICCYAVRRYVEHAEPRVGTYDEDHFLRIFHLFDREGAKLHGLRHFCDRINCACLICAARQPRLPPKTALPQTPPVIPPPSADNTSSHLNRNAGGHSEDSN